MLVRTPSNQLGEPSGGESELPLISQTPLHSSLVALAKAGACPPTKNLDVRLRGHDGFWAAVTSSLNARLLHHRFQG